MAKIYIKTCVLILFVLNFFSTSGVLFKRSENKRQSTAHTLVHSRPGDLEERKLYNSQFTTRREGIFTENERKRFAEECLAAHNEYRKLHNVPPLTLSEKLNLNGQKWADHLAKTGTFEHQKNNKYGENLYSLSTSRKITRLTMNGSDAVNVWYKKEIPYFKFGTEDVDNRKTGHFTQVVWANTKHLGVGVTKKANGNTVYAVCEYEPRGNVRGRYTANVPPPVGNANKKIKSGGNTRTYRKKPKH